MNDSHICKSTLSILVLILLTLVGCGATNSLTVQERETIKTISISPSDISYEDKKELIYLMTKGRAAASFWGGGVGALIYETNKGYSTEEILLSQLNDHEMFKEVVSEAFTYHFKKSGIFQSVLKSKEDADAFLSIKLPIFQIIYSEDDLFKLTFRLDVELTDSSGDILWQDWDFFTAFNDELPEHTLEDYLTNPEILKQSISIVAQMIAREFIIDMGGNAAVLNRQLHAAKSD